MCTGYLHFAWSERDPFNELLGVVTTGIQENDADELKPYLILL